VTETIGILGRKGPGRRPTPASWPRSVWPRGPGPIIDPTDACAGLRSSKDGKEEGFPITVLGGDHGDAPLEETAGKVIADCLAEEAPPAGCSPWAISRRGPRAGRRDFCERLYEKKPDPRWHLVIDREAGRIRSAAHRKGHEDFARRP